MRPRDPSTHPARRCIVLAQGTRVLCGSCMHLVALNEGEDDEDGISFHLDIQSQHSTFANWTTHCSGSPPSHIDLISHFPHLISSHLTLILSLTHLPHNLHRMHLNIPLASRPDLMHPIPLTSFGCFAVSIMIFALFACLLACLLVCCCSYLRPHCMTTILIRATAAYMSRYVVSYP